MAAAKRLIERRDVSSRQLTDKHSNHLILGILLLDSDTSIDHAHDVGVHSGIGRNISNWEESP